MASFITNGFWSKHNKPSHLGAAPPDTTRRAQAGESQHTDTRESPARGVWARGAG